MHVCVTFTKETEQLLNIFAIKSLLINFTDSKFFSNSEQNNNERNLKSTTAKHNNILNILDAFYKLKTYT